MSNKPEKIHITFKTPDAVRYALEDANLNQDEEDVILEKLSKWIKYEELVTIEFDLENGTATVIPA